MKKKARRASGSLKAKAKAGMSGGSLTPAGAYHQEPTMQYHGSAAVQAVEETNTQVLEGIGTEFPPRPANCTDKQLYEEWQRLHTPLGTTAGTRRKVSFTDNDGVESIITVIERSHTGAIHRAKAVGHSADPSVFAVDKKTYLSRMSSSARSRIALKGTSKSTVEYLINPSAEEYVHDCFAVGAGIWSDVVAGLAEVSNVQHEDGYHINGVKTVPSSERMEQRKLERRTETSDEQAIADHCKQVAANDAAVTASNVIDVAEWQAKRAANRSKFFSDSRKIEQSVATTVHIEQTEEVITPPTTDVVEELTRNDRAALATSKATQRRYKLAGIRSAKHSLLGAIQRGAESGVSAIAFSFHYWNGSDKLLDGTAVKMADHSSICKWYYEGMRKVRENVTPHGPRVEAFLEARKEWSVEDARKASAKAVADHIKAKQSVVMQPGPLTNIGGTEYGKTEAGVLVPPMKIETPTGLVLVDGGWSTRSGKVGELPIL